MTNTHRRNVINFVLAAATATCALAQQGAQTQIGAAAGGQATTQPAQDISLDQAQKVIEGAVKKAAELKIKQNVAVVDAGGSLKAFVRMDGAWLGSIDIAQKKAKTARYFDMPTGEVGKLSQPGKPLYMIEISNHGLITFPGGTPIKLSDGTIIGAVGVSGSTVDNDQACADAGAAAVK